MTAPTPSPREFVVKWTGAPLSELADAVAARDAALLAPLREQVERLDALVVTHLNEANAQADRAERAEKRVKELEAELANRS